MTQTMRDGSTMTENMWKVTLLSISCIVLLITAYCLSRGITTIFMHLYYIPIVLLSYHYRKKGFFLSVLLSFLYLVLVVFYIPGSLAEIEGAVVRASVFIGIAALVAYLSEHLRASEEKYRIFFTTSRDCVFITTGDGRWIDLNDAAVVLFGYRSREELEKVNVIDLYDDPGERDRHLSVINIMGYSKEYPVRLRKKDGTIIQTLITSVAIKDDRGKITGYQGTIRDVTEQKRLEEALITTAREWEITFNATSDGICLIDADQKIQRCNIRMSEILGGIPQEELVGRPCWPIVHKTTGPIPECPFVSAKETLHRTKIEIPVGDLWFEVTADPILDSSGKFTGAVHIMRDITERRATDEVLAQSEERYRTLAETSPDQIFISGRDDTMQYVNTAALKLFRLSYDQVIGKPRKNLFPPKIADAQGLSLKKVFETGEWVRKEELIQFGKQELWIDTSLVPLKDKAGNVTSVLGIARDITERKRAEELLKQFNEELEQNVKSRTEELNASLQEKVILLREIHHRVKNNLQIIISLINLQMRQVDDKQLKQIMAETQNRVRAMSLVHEKLYQSENLSQIDLSDYTRFLATHLFSYYGVNFQKVALEITIEKVMLDINTAIPLSLIINELVSNALKHGFPFDRKGTITISSQYDNKVLTLVIKDDGIGLPPDLDWKNPESLGLQLVNNLVEQLNGTIKVERESGTTYIISVHREIE